MKERWNHSLRLKIITAFVGVTIVILMATWLLTKLALPKVYLKSKLKDLTGTYEEVALLLSQTGEFTAETESGLNGIRGKRNVAIMIMDSSKQGVFVSEPLYSTGSFRMQERMYELMELKLFGFKLGDGMWKEKRLRSNERYEIYEMVARGDAGSFSIALPRGERDTEVTAPPSKGTYIDLIGQYGERYYIYLSIDYESITKATGIATGFQLRAAAVIMLLLGTGALVLLSRMITRPLETMSAAAKQMCELDFAARCPEERNDEIGELGHSLNVLSEQLERTIGDLKQANNEMERDLKRREETEAMRSDFISNVSHELKTPLALIQGYAEGLQDNISDDEESREYYCEVIIDEAAKMNGIVRKLLSLNQLEYGEQMLEYDRFDIYEVLRGVLRDTEILQKQQEVTVHLYGEGPCYVWADEYRIEEVITNYVSNAFHHVSRSKEIAVSVKKTDATVRVSVYNTGEPIPESNLDKVWIKFYKVDKARTREYGGSGIGLSVVKAIMDAHNRQCGVINHEGGVEFWFELESAEGRTGFLKKE